MIDGSSEIRPILSIQPPNSIRPITEQHAHDRQQRKGAGHHDSHQDEEPEEVVDTVELSVQAQSILQHAGDSAVDDPSVTKSAPSLSGSASGDSHLDISV